MNAAFDAESGVPIYPRLSSGKEACSFAKADSRISLTGRTATIGQAGNAMHSQCVALVILYSITQSQAVVQNESPAAAQNQNINSSDLPGIPSDLDSDTKSIQLKRPRIVNQNDSDHSVLKSHRVTASGLSSAGSSGSANTSSSVGGMMWKFKSMKPKRTL